MDCEEETDTEEAPPDELVGGAVLGLEELLLEALEELLPEAPEELLGGAVEREGPAGASEEEGAGREVVGRGAAEAPWLTAGTATDAISAVPVFCASAVVGNSPIKSKIAHKSAMGFFLNNAKASLRPNDKVAHYTPHSETCTANYVQKLHLFVYKIWMVVIFHQGVQHFWVITSYAFIPVRGLIKAYIFGRIK